MSQMKFSMLAEMKRLAALPGATFDSVISGMKVQFPSFFQADDWADRIKVQVAYNRMDAAAVNLQNEPSEVAVTKSKMKTSKTPTAAELQQNAADFKDAYYKIGDALAGLDYLSSKRLNSGADSEARYRQLQSVLSEMNYRLSLLKTWGDTNIQNWD
jgi:hypothetical protein